MLLVRQTKNHKMSFEHTESIIIPISLNEIFSVFHVNKEIAHLKSVSSSISSTNLYQNQALNSQNQALNSELDFDLNFENDDLNQSDVNSSKITVDHDFFQLAIINTNAKGNTSNGSMEIINGSSNSPNSSVVSFSFSLNMDRLNALKETAPLLSSKSFQDYYSLLIDALGSASLVSPTYQAGKAFSLVRPIGTSKMSIEMYYSPAEGVKSFLGEITLEKDVVPKTLVDILLVIQKCNAFNASQVSLLDQNLKKGINEQAMILEQ